MSGTSKATRIAIADHVRKDLIKRYMNLMYETVENGSRDAALIYAHEVTSLIVKLGEEPDA